MQGRDSSLKRMNRLAGEKERGENACDIALSRLSGYHLHTPTLAIRLSSQTVAAEGGEEEEVKEEDERDIGDVSNLIICICFNFPSTPLHSKEVFSLSHTLHKSLQYPNLIWTQELHEMWYLFSRTFWGSL